MTIEEFKHLFLGMVEDSFPKKEKVLLTDAIGLTLKFPANKKHLAVTQGEYESLVYIVARTSAIMLDLSSRVQIEVSLKFFFVSDDENHRYTKNYENIGKKHRIPIDIISRDEYFFDYETKKFFDNKGDEKTINSIIDDLYKLHTLPSKIVRAKLWIYKSVFPALLKTAYIIISGVLNLLYGIKSPELIKRYFANQDDRKIDEIVTAQEKSIPGDVVDFFGVKLKKRTLITYCAATLLSYSIFYLYDYYPRYLVRILENNFLVTTFVVLTLALFEIASKLLDRLLDNISKEYFHLQFQEIKVS